MFFLKVNNIIIDFLYTTDVNVLFIILLLYYYYFFIKFNIFILGLAYAWRIYWFLCCVVFAMNEEFKLLYETQNIYVKLNCSIIIFV